MDSLSDEFAFFGDEQVGRESSDIELFVKLLIGFLIQKVVFTCQLVFF
ncbi:hypothetical protein [Algoriphagus boritolerans]